MCKDINQNNKKFCDRLDILIYLLILLLKKEQDLDDKTKEKLAKDLAKINYPQDQIAKMLTIAKRKVNEMLKK